MFKKSSKKFALTLFLLFFLERIGKVSLNVERMFIAYNKIWKSIGRVSLSNMNVDIRVDFIGKLTDLCRAAAMMRRRRDEMKTASNSSINSSLPD